MVAHDIPLNQVSFPLKAYCYFIQNKKQDESEQKNVNDKISLN